MNLPAAIVTGVICMLAVYCVVTIAVALYAGADPWRCVEVATIDATFLAFAFFARDMLLDDEA